MTYPKIQINVGNGQKPCYLMYQVAHFWYCGYLLGNLESPEQGMFSTQFNQKHFWYQVAHFWYCG
jgi:hypothetical protein